MLANNIRQITEDWKLEIKENQINLLLTYWQAELGRPSSKF